MLAGQIRDPAVETNGPHALLIRPAVPEFDRRPLLRYATLSVRLQASLGRDHFAHQTARRVAGKSDSVRPVRLPQADHRRAYIRHPDNRNFARLALILNSDRPTRCTNVRIAENWKPTQLQCNLHQPDSLTDTPAPDERSTAPAPHVPIQS
jgi:hypothetical protein